MSSSHQPYGAAKILSGLVDELVAHGASVQDAGRDAPGIRERKLDMPLIQPDYNPEPSSE